MKRMIRVGLCLVLIINLCACTALEISGLDNYKEHTCSVELTKNLFPDPEFIEQYPYIEGDYHFYEMWNLTQDEVNAFAYMQYAENTYLEAKAECLETWDFCDGHWFSYGGYQFSEILCHTIKIEDMRVVGCDFPRHFNMFGYNDETKTLVFMGYYNGKLDDAEKNLAQTDFEAFINKTYGQYLGKTGDG